MINANLCEFVVESGSKIEIINNFDRARQSSIAIPIFLNTFMESLYILITI